MFQDTEADATPPLRPRRGRPSRSGKAASLRLAGTPLVQGRTSSTPSDTETTDLRSRKRQKVSNSPSVDIDSNAEGTQLQEDQEEQDDRNIIAEIKTELTLTSDALLSDSPQEQNGLWACQNEGCGYTVENVREKVGKAKVHAHFLQHADDIAGRENLVLQERRPHLPISNLLEKLRSLGEAARLAGHKEVGGRVVPPPIKRQMIA